MPSAQHLTSMLCGRCWWWWWSRWRRVAVSRTKGITNYVGWLSFNIFITFFKWICKKKTKFKKSSPLFYNFESNSKQLSVPSKRSSTTQSIACLQALSNFLTSSRVNSGTPLQLGATSSNSNIQQSLIFKFCFYWAPISGRRRCHPRKVTVLYHWPAFKGSFTFYNTFRGIFV